MNTESDKQKMQHVYDYFNINGDELNIFLKKYNGFIAGSAALTGFLKTQSKITETNLIPSDIDIWIPFNTKHSDIVEEFKNSFNLPGYECINLNENTYSNFIKPLTNFDVVYEFKLDEHRKIQILPVNNDHDNTLKNFDLSFCATSWDGETFNSLYPDLTKMKTGFFMNENLFNKKIRTSKYENRGFKIYNNKDEIL